MIRAVPSEKTKKDLTKFLTQIISETNGIALTDTLQLLANSDLKNINNEAFGLVEDFRKKLVLFQINQCAMNDLLLHPVADAFFDFFKNFPLKYHESHIHLTGSVTADYLYPRLMDLLAGPNKAVYEQKIKEVYGPSSLPLKSIKDVDQLLRLKEGEGFDTYLKILYLPKLILTSREAHADTAYHMASELYHNYNVGSLRLKFTLSRSSQSSSEQVPGLESLTSEDVVLGLYDGFKRFKRENSNFDFILSPSIRKETNFFDSQKYNSRREHFIDQVNDIIYLVEKYPYLSDHLCEVDTVGNENDFFRKEHFNELRAGFRKLQYYGFRIRSHHGETWHTLKKGIQAVDNAMNIWHIDTLEHGLSLGINPNYYFHRLFQTVLEANRRSQKLDPKSNEYKEIADLDWGHHASIRDKLLSGEVLSEFEVVLFTKAKFHTAREVEHYQHDVLNRMIDKGVSLVSLPSSNNKLTGRFQDYKDHPFSWWEKKGVQLGVGTDNYITLNTNYIQEMLILLFTDPSNLKITKLLMVTTHETRRPYISHLLWKMRKIKFS